MLLYEDQHLKKLNSRHNLVGRSRWSDWEVHFLQVSSPSLFLGSLSDSSSRMVHYGSSRRVGLGDGHAISDGGRSEGEMGRGFRSDSHLAPEVVPHLQSASLIEAVVKRGATVGGRGGIERIIDRSEGDVVQLRRTVHLSEASNANFQLAFANEALSGQGLSSSSGGISSSGTSGSGIRSSGTSNSPSSSGTSGSGISSSGASGCSGGRSVSCRHVDRRAVEWGMTKLRFRIEGTRPAMH